MFGGTVMVFHRSPDLRPLGFCLCRHTNYVGMQLGLLQQGKKGNRPVLEKRVLRKIFGSKWKVVTGSCKKLHN